MSVALVMSQISLKATRAITTAHTTPSRWDAEQFHDVRDNEAESKTKEIVLSRTTVLMMVWTSGILKKKNARVMF